MKMNQKFLLIDFDSGSELSGSLNADRKLVQRIQVLHATAEHGVAVVLHGITFDQLKNVIRSASVPHTFHLKAYHRHGFC